jgi:outer membrane protein assembly factor BamB
LLGNGTFYSTPAVAYDRLYVGSTDGRVYSFGASTGALRWSHRTGAYVYGSAAVWRRRVLVGSYDHFFYSFDAATGDVDWRFHADGPISGSASVIDGVVYFATLRGTTYALDARTGALVRSFPQGKYASATADADHVFVVGYSAIYAFSPRRHAAR